jgi:hypothetical protein
VIAKARELVEAAPDGVRYSELHKRIVAAFPEIPPNTIHGALHRFRNDLPDGIYLPARGLYKHVKFQSREDEGVKPLKGRKLKEEDFYEPFADWLVNELEECTKAIGNVPERVELRG